MSLGDDRITVLEYLAEKENRSNYVLIEYIIGPKPYRYNQHAKRIIKSLVTDQLIEIDKETGVDPGPITVGGKKNQPAKTFRSETPYRGLEARITAQGLSVLTTALQDKAHNEPNANPIINKLADSDQLLPNSNTIVLCGKSFSIKKIALFITFLILTFNILTYYRGC